MAHNASVSANDLATGVEVSAGAAKQAGVNLQQLNALIAAGVRNSGQSGSTIGTMWKTVLAHISSDTPKIQKAFAALGVSMTNADGSMRPVYDMLVQISKESGNLDASQKQALMTITGGVRQYSRFAQAISNVNTIQADYNVAMNSAGAANKYAQEQLHTLSAELTRLRDSIQQMAYNAGSGGLGEFLAGFVRDITALIEGLQKVSPSVLIAGASFTGLLVSVKALSAMSNTLNGAFVGLRNSVAFLANPVGSLTAAWSDMTGKVRTTTAALAAKTAAMDTDVIANEAEAVSSASVVAGLEEEAVAAEETAGAFDSLDIVSGGLALVIGAAVTGLALWAVHAGTASQSTQQQTQDVQALTQAYASHKQQVDDLLTQYQKLDQATQDGSVFKDSQQQQDYYSVMTQISGILPNVTDYTDKNGQAHIQSAAAIQREITQQEQLLKLQAQATIANGPSDYKKQLNDLQNYQRSFNAINKEAQSGQTKQLQSVNQYTGKETFVTQMLSDQQIAKIRTQLAKYQSEMDGATNAIVQENQKLAQAFVTVSGSQLTDQSQGILSNLIGSLDISSFNGDSDKIKSAVQSIADAVVQLQQSANGGQISTSALNAVIKDLSQNGIRMLSQSLDSASQAAQGAANATKTLSDVLNSATANASLLNQAQQELTNQHRLSDTTLQALIKAYPNFANAVGLGDKAMLQFINTAKNQEQTTIDAQKAQTEAVIAGTKERIAAISAEIQAMQAAALAAAATVSNLTADGSINMRNPAIQTFVQNTSQLADSKSTLQQALAELNSINVASYTVSNSGYTASGPKSPSTPSASAQSAAYKQPFQDLSQQDTIALQSYDAAIKRSSDNMSTYDTSLTSALGTLSKHITSTKDLTAATKAYSVEVAAITANEKALNNENAKIHQLLPRVQKDIAGVNAQFKSGKITAAEHSSVISTLNSEYQRLNTSLQTNQKALSDDRAKMASLTGTMESQMISDLQTAYQDQQKMQEDALTNIYQPQIDALTNQKNAVDALVTSLQAQWQTQSALDTLQQDQADLASIEANKSYRIVNPDGTVSYTYDQSAAQTQAQKIADEQTQIAHDAQIKQLNDQSSALSTEITNLTNAYNDKKSQLDAYWAYKESQDQIQQAADNLILQDGMKGAFTIVETYADQIIGKYNDIQSAAAQAGGAIAASLGNAGIPTGSGTSSGKVYTLDNGNGVPQTGTNYNALVNQNGGQWLNHQFVKGYYVNGVWTPGALHAANGGMVPLNLGTPGVDSVPAMLMPGERVLNPPQWDDVMSRMRSSSNTATHAPSVHLHGDLVLPNVKTANDAQEIVNALLDQLNEAI